MSEELLTVEAVARRLQLHPKTVLRLIRDGRLRGTRIGKAYRVQRADLDAFAGVSRSSHPGRPRVTSIVDLTEVSMELSRRLVTALQATLTSQSARVDPIHLDTAYDPELRQLKVVIVASPADAAALLSALDTFWKAFA